MNTPTHLLVGTAAFGRPLKPGTYGAALAGAIMPDLSLYLMVAYAIQVMGIPAQVVFRDYYYSDAWQAVFAVDNSFILWGGLLAIALWRKMPRVLAFAGGGLLHLAMDFPLHSHDARRHFWPVSDWVFHSPVSYWDGQAHADIVGPIALALAVLCAVLLFRRFSSWWIRGLTLVLLAFEAMSSGVWRFVF